MKVKNFFVTFIILSTLALYGCKTSERENLNPQTYEQILNELSAEKGKDDYLEFISIEKMDFNIEAENELEQRMNFTFLIKNLTDDNMKVSYVGYFPNELEQYYLSRSKIELEQVDLKPGQIIAASQSMLVQHEKTLSTEQSQFLKDNGHVMYFAISLNDKLYYLNVKLDELGFDQ
ncbi:MAG: hypothetical protein RR588_08445 [Solibacillus sp.]